MKPTPAVWPTPALVLILPSLPCLAIEDIHGCKNITEQFDEELPTIMETVG